MENDTWMQVEILEGGNMKYISSVDHDLTNGIFFARNKFHISSIIIVIII